MVINKQFRLASRPTEMPTRANWFVTLGSEEALGEGEVQVQTLYLSLDPAMRGWMSDTPSYIAPVQRGEVMRALGVGRVILSNHREFAVGDYAGGLLGVQTYATVHGSQLSKVDPELAPLPVYLGALGMPGMTAYFGLLDIGRPAAGETVVVSAAAGAVGMTVGQIAKIKGCRVVGIAGSAQKCDYLRSELQFDAAIDYKTEDLMAALAQHCPGGINVYFDNVGGESLEASLAHLALRARIVICGAISQYNSTSGMKGPANYLSLLVNRARMQGMLVSDYESRYSEAITDIGRWIAAGELKTREDIVEGFDDFPDVFLRLFTGENFGKLVLKVA